MTDRLMRLREVMERTGLGKTTIYRKMQEGAFPRPLSIGPTCTRWRESEVERWVDGLKRTGGAANSDAGTGAGTGAE